MKLKYDDMGNYYTLDGRYRIYHGAGDIWRVQDTSKSYPTNRLYWDKNLDVCKAWLEKHINKKALFEE